MVSTIVGVTSTRIETRRVGVKAGVNSKPSGISWPLVLPLVSPRRALEIPIAEEQSPATGRMEGDARADVVRLTVAAA